MRLIVGDRTAVESGTAGRPDYAAVGLSGLHLHAMKLRIPVAVERDRSGVRPKIDRYREKPGENEFSEPRRNDRRVVRRLETSWINSRRASTVRTVYPCRQRPLAIVNRCVN